MHDALPVAPGLPLVGSLAHYTRDPLAFLERVAAQGDMVEMRFPRARFTFVREPRIVEQILQKQASSMQKDKFLQGLKRFLGQGLLTAEGDFWKRQRRLSQPSFHRDRVAGYADTMVELAARDVDGWRDGEPRDLHADMMHLTMRIVARTMFGTDVGAAAEVGPALEAVMEHVANPAFVIVPALERLPLPTNVRYRRATSNLDKLVREIIRERRGREDPEARDLLSMLLAARDDDGGRMSDEQLRDEVLTIFMAGHETTALALSFAVHLLATHPEADTALATSLAETLHGRRPTADDMPRLTYAEHVVLETLRLYPPAWSIGRESTAAVTLEGRAFAAGTQFWMSPWVMHRDPRTFTDPMHFRPERWADGLQKRLHRFAYCPFGGGPRVCIGLGFAMMEAVLLLSVIAQRYRFTCDDDGVMELFPSITLRPKRGVKVRVHRRETVTRAGVEGAAPAAE